MSSTDDLFTAIEADNVTGVNTAIGAGADVDATNSDNLTPLILASKLGVQDAIVNALISAGANVNAVSNENKNALMWALLSGAVSIASILIANGSQLLDTADDFGTTALHHAASVNDTTNTSALISASVQVDAKDLRGQTPLMYAAMNGAADVVTVLLNANASSGEKDNSGRDAESIARNYGNTTVANVIASSTDKATKTVSANTTLTSLDEFVFIDTLSAITLTLPSISTIPGLKKMFRIFDVKGNVSQFNVTIAAANGDTIMGLQSIVMDHDNDTVILISDTTTRWLVQMASSVPATRTFACSDTKTTGVHGGTAVDSSWNVRTLNTVDLATAGASLLNNTINLPAGRFRVAATAPAFTHNGKHQLRLYNVTSSSVLVIGNTCRGSDIANIIGTFTLATVSDVRLEHYIENGKSIIGLGRALGKNGNSERFANITFDFI
jgi:ankyrin repeat protein